MQKSDDSLQKRHSYGDRVLNNTEMLLIEILSAFVNGRKPEITTEYNATELYELSKAQSVSGIVGYVLNKYGFTDFAKAEKRFEDIFDKIVTQFIRKDFYAQNLIKKFDEAKIPHILFKGLVVKECYPVPELRTFGDIDIIIPKNQREKSHNLMCGLGYEWELMDGGEVYSYKKDKEHYELHTTLNSEKTKLSAKMNSFWDYAKPKCGFTYEFEHEFHLSYLISHIEKHLYGTGAGVRMYLDIALFLNKYKENLDLEKAREILKECELEKFFDSTLYICQRWFDTDVKPKEEMSPELYEQFCRYTFKGGVFGIQERESTNENEVRRVISEKGKSGKLSIVLSHIFPPYREVRRLYPFFNGKPYLLPIGWVVHWFKAGKRSGLKNIRQFASADAEKVKKEKEFFDKIGSSR